MGPVMPANYQLGGGQQMMGMQPNMYNANNYQTGNRNGVIIRNY
jgi:hypothetical protein